MGIELLVLAAAGFAILKVVELFSPWRPSIYLMSVLLFLCAFVAHFIPEPWLLYVAASGLIPVLYKLAGGSNPSTPGEQIRVQLDTLVGRRRLKKTVRDRPRPRSRIGSRVPRI